MDLILGFFLSSDWRAMFNFKVGEKKIINVPLVFVLLFFSLIWKII